MAREMFDPAAVLRKVVPTGRARRVGLPSPFRPSEEGREASQSAMYSRSGIEVPATSDGVWAFGGPEVGKLVDAIPEVERASIRRAISVEVNHDG